jgi:peptidoglycan/LPS O-acetylase OafA/YrhL
MIPVFPLGWTLNYEMLFYVLFAGTMTQKRSVGMLLAAAALGRLGDASYSLYLVHPIAFLLVRNAVLRLGAWDHIAGICVYAYAALLLLLMAAALLMWWTFERPITRALQGQQPR